MKEFKKCPFCGGYDVFVIYNIEKNPPNLKFFRVICETCCAEGPFDLTENKAIYAWNKRSKK